MPRIAADLGTDIEVVGRLRVEYEKYLQVLCVDGTANDDPAVRRGQQYTVLRFAMLARRRATVIRLRDERRLDDIVLRQLQTRLDIEEVRLFRRELAD